MTLRRPSHVPFDLQSRRTQRRAACVVLVSLISFATVRVVIAAQLTEAAEQAYAAYFNKARQSFLERVNRGLNVNDADRALLRKGETVVRPGGGDGILDAPRSLIHHWFAATKIPGVSLDQVVTISRAYPDYPKIFHPVLTAKVLSDEGESLRVQLRMRESAAGMSATLDMTSRVLYARVDAQHAHVISTAEEIREVKDAGQSDERRLPAGNDSGYLWRAGAFTSFVDEGDGVYMEMETIGLSRPFPPMLGWMIEPIARRIGRRSVEQSVEEFRQAVLNRYAKGR